MHLTTDQGLVRLTAAARQAGMTPATFETASQTGQIPVEVLRIGPRQIRYVRATELNHFLAGSTRNIQE